MPLYYIKYKMKDDARSDTLTLFGSMNAEQDAADMGPDIKMLGRWHNMGDMTGYVIVSAPDNATLNKWVFNWTESACDCVLTPIVDDDTARTIILKGEACGWKAGGYIPYGEKGYEPEAGESIFAVEYVFAPGKKMEGYTAFGGLTKEMDDGDAGKVVKIGRWHNLGAGTGFGICKLPKGADESDLYKWAYNWTGMADIMIYPVNTDAGQRKIVSSKPGFDKKLEAVMKKMGM